jgi:PAS domain S-box-containing protein
LLIDRPAMHSRLVSLKTYLAAMVGALALSLLGITGLAMAGVPAWQIGVVGLVLLITIAGTAMWANRRIETSFEALTIAAGQIARGEPVTPTTELREGTDLAGSLATIAQVLGRQESEVREGRERYRALAESLPALVWIMTQDGRPVFQNERVSLYTGQPLQSDQEAQGALTHPDDLHVVQDARSRSAERPEEYKMEIRLRRQDGTYRWHLVTTAPLSFPASEDNETLWLSTAIDIENRKQGEELQARLASVLERKVAEATQQLRDETVVRQKAERQLRQTQKMEAISRLTGGIAHDLNNKLMVISANIDAVTKQIKDQPQLRRKLLAALVAADQAAALMSKLLAFARQRDLQVQYIDIAEHLDSITSLLDRSFLSDSVEVRLSIPDDLWPVEVDPHELETAIVNLAVNARDAMPRGGAISIEARNVRVRKGSLSDPDLVGDFVQIAIADTGEGIEPQHLEHVLEPFFTTKEASRASGLGLSQVHGFAEQLGGTVEVSSTVGVGTSVTLFLPRADLPARLGTKPDLDDLTDDEDEPKPAAEILVVDDEVEVALALQGMLEESGYAVRTAIGANEAIEAINTRRPHLLLTDVTMPGTMDGVALAREVRQIDASLPVVLITGNPMVVAEMSEFPLLQKPIVSRELRAAIQRYLTVPDEGRVVPLFPVKKS